MSDLQLVPREPSKSEERREGLAADPADPSADPHLSGMVPEPGVVMQALGDTFFGYIQTDEEDLAPVREAAKRGSIVYVVRTRSLLDYLYFNWLALRADLPLARFANGISTVMFQPLRRSVRGIARWLGVRRRHGKLPDPVDGGWLQALVERGDPVLLFLRRRRGRLYGGEELPTKDVVEILVEAQRRRDRPISVVPLVLVWQRSPDRSSRGLIEFLLGEPDAPGRIRKILHFLRYYRQGVLRVGRPVQLDEFLAQQEGQPTARIARKLRWVLLGYLYRERRVVKGPDVRPRHTLLERVLSEPTVKEAIARVAREEGRSVPRIERRSLKILDRMASDFRWGWIMVWKTAMDFVVSRIYSGVDFQPEDAARLREAARSGTVLLLPGHRSHLDYLLLSWVMVRAGIMPPHVAAGDNLAFFPMGALFRRGGGFFIRRSFVGDGLYEALLTHYVRALIAEGYTQEFFLEGGRSRTGKMLPPKIGLLGTYVEAAADKVSSDIQMVPVGITYERIVEERSYTGELSGGTKRRESAGELVKGASVLARRFGRVYVTVNQPISLKESLSFLPGDYAELDREDRKQWLKRLARHITAEIQDVTVVTPSAVAALTLLTHDRRGLPREVFHRRATLFRRWLDRREARFSDAWHFPEDALDEAVSLFADSGLVDVVDGAGERGDVIAVHEDGERRMTLDYYKNTVLFHFVPAAFVATALLLDDGDSARRSVVQRRFDFLVELFDQEFFFHPDLPTEHLVRDALDGLTDLGVLAEGPEEPPPGDEARAALTEAETLPELRPAGGGDPIVRVLDYGKAALFLATIRNFYEAYWVVLEAADALRAGPRSEKELVKEAMAAGRRHYLTEDVTRAEAVGQVNLRNAVRHFTDRGVFVPTGEGRERLLRLDEDELHRFREPMNRLFRSGGMRGPSALWR